MLSTPHCFIVPIAAFALLVLTPCSSMAQEMHSNDQPAARLGLRLGLTSSTFEGGDPHFYTTANFDRNSQIKRTGGFEAIAFVRNPVSRSLDIQTELGYTQRGGQHLSEGLGSRWEEEFRFSYVHGALLFQLRPWGASQDGFGLSVGPFANVFAGRKVRAVRIDDDDGEVTERTSNDLDALQAIDLGIVFGGDVTFASRYVLDLRLALGLRSFVNEEELGPIAQSQQTSIRNTAIVIGLGILL